MPRLLSAVLCVVWHRADRREAKHRHAHEHQHEDARSGYAQDASRKNNAPSSDIATIINAKIPSGLLAAASMIFGACLISLSILWWGNDT